MDFPVPDEPLQGRVVALRPWRPEDAEWYVSARDEEIFRWTTEPRELAPDVVRRVIEANNREPRWAGFAIADAITGELLGNIALTVAEPERRTGEVMYWLAAAARGRGAASDAVRTITRWAFEALPIDRIELRTNFGNEASQRVARRTEFAPRGERDDQLLFEIVRTEKTAQLAGNGQ